MSEGNSYRQILRSSSIIGGASIINIIVGLLRMKVAAVLLGPTGVGLIGLLTNLVTTATGIAGLGVGNVGTRQIAEAVGYGEPARIALVRRALFWLTLALAILGGTVFWLLRGVLAARVLGDASWTGPLGWLSIAVALSVAAASQNALLNGMRHIGDIARISVWSATLSTAGAIAALWLLGRDGVVVYVLAAPFASFILGHWYVSRLPRHAEMHAGVAVLSEQWRIMLSLGFAFMVASLAGTVGQLVVRTMVQHKLGGNALGQFQAAWTISMTYIGFILSAMGTDYYPRLTAVVDDRLAVSRLVNEQTEIALLLASPIILMMLGGAPYVIELLYSEKFDGAIAILRWQVLGDVLKIASFPLAFILLASGSGRTYMLAEGAAMAFFILLTYLGLPQMGVEATGQAFLGMYAFYLALMYYLAYRRIDFRWTKRVRMQAGAIFLAALVVHLVAGWHEVAGVIFGVGAGAFFAVYAVKRLIKLSGSTNPMVEKLRNSISRQRNRRGH